MNETAATKFELIMSSSHTIVVYILEQCSHTNSEWNRHNEDEPEDEPAFKPTLGQCLKFYVWKNKKETSLINGHKIKYEVDVTQSYTQLDTT